MPVRAASIKPRSFASDIPSDPPPRSVVNPRMREMSEEEVNRVSMVRQRAWQNYLRDLVSGDILGFENTEELPNGERIVLWVDVPDDVPQELRQKVRQELAKQLYASIRYYLKNASSRTLGYQDDYKKFIDATISGHLVRVSRVKDRDGAIVPIPAAFRDFILQIKPRPGRWGMDPNKAFGRVRRKIEKSAAKKKEGAE